MSLMVVVMSSYFQTASMGLAILLLTWSLIPDSCKVLNFFFCVIIMLAYLA
jgi:hypothetical protein